MAKPKVISVANQKDGVGKSTTVYNFGVCLAMDGKKVLLLDVDPQGNLTKMLGQRKPHDLPLTLANAMNDFDFAPGNRSLSVVEVGLVNVMSRKTVLRQYVDCHQCCIRFQGIHVNPRHEATRPLYCFYYSLCLPPMRIKS